MQQSQSLGAFMHLATAAQAGMLQYAQDSASALHPHAQQAKLGISPAWPLSNNLSSSGNSAGNAAGPMLGLERCATSCSLSSSDTRSLMHNNNNSGGFMLAAPARSNQPFLLSSAPGAQLVMGGMAGTGTGTIAGASAGAVHVHTSRSGSNASDLHHAQQAAVVLQHGTTAPISAQAQTSQPYGHNTLPRPSSGSDMAQAAALPHRMPAPVASGTGAAVAADTPMPTGLEGTDGGGAGRSPRTSVSPPEPLLPRPAAPQPPTFVGVLHDASAPPGQQWLANLTVVNGSSSTLAAVGRYGSAADAARARDRAVIACGLTDHLNFQQDQQQQQQQQLFAFSAPTMAAGAPCQTSSFAGGLGSMQLAFAAQKQQASSMLLAARQEAEVVMCEGWGGTPRSPPAPTAPRSVPLQSGLVAKAIRMGPSRAGMSSSFLGVTWYKASKRWQARLCCDNKKYHLGYFGTEEDAARAYDLAVLRYKGPSAPRNFADSHLGMVLGGGEQASPAMANAGGACPSPRGGAAGGRAPRASASRRQLQTQHTDDQLTTGSGDGVEEGGDEQGDAMEVDGCMKRKSRVSDLSGPPTTSPGRCGMDLLAQLAAEADGATHMDATPAPPSALGPSLPLSAPTVMGSGHAVMLPEPPAFAAFSSRTEAVSHVASPRSTEHALTARRQNSVPLSELPVFEPELYCGGAAPAATTLTFVWDGASLHARS